MVLMYWSIAPSWSPLLYRWSPYCVKMSISPSWSYCWLLARLKDHGKGNCTKWVKSFTEKTHQWTALLQKYRGNHIVLWQERQLLFNMDFTWWLVCSYFSWTTFLIWSEYLFLAIDISVKKKSKVNSQQHWYKKLVISKTATNVYDWFTGTLFELWPFCLLLECTHSPTQRGRQWRQGRGRSKQWTCSGCRTQWRCSSPWSALPCATETLTLLYKTL